MEEFLDKLLTFVDKETDWKENNETTNSQVINHFLANNDELVKKLIDEMCDGSPEQDTKSGLNIADVNGWRSVIKVSDLKRGDIIKNRLSGNTYVVDSNYGEWASAVTVQDITNPSEWMVHACR